MTKACLYHTCADGLPPRTEDTNKIGPEEAAPPLSPRSPMVKALRRYAADPYVVSR